MADELNAKVTTAERSAERAVKERDKAADRLERANARLREKQDELARAKQTLAEAEAQAAKAFADGEDAPDLSEHHHKIAEVESHVRIAQRARDDIASEHEAKITEARDRQRHLAECQVAVHKRKLAEQLLAAKATMRDLQLAQQRAGLDPTPNTMAVSNAEHFANHSGNGDLIEKAKVA